MIHEYWLNERRGRILCKNPKETAEGDIIHLKRPEKDIYMQVVSGTAYEHTGCVHCPFICYDCRVYHHCSNSIDVTPCGQGKLRLIYINMDKILENL